MNFSLLLWPHKVINYLPKRADQLLKISFHITDTDLKGILILEKNYYLIGIYSVAILAIFSIRPIKAKGPDINLLNVSPFVSWAVRPRQKFSISLAEAWEKFQKKGDIVVAVVDTGTSYAHPFLIENHHVFEGKVGRTNYGRDFSVKDLLQAFQPNDKHGHGTLPLLGRKSLLVFQPQDKHGHGTHISGIVKSVFPGTKMLTLKYYGEHATGADNLNATIKALQYAVDKNVDIINYSGGGPNPSPRELEVLKEAERKGIVVIAAAGNERSNIDIPRNAYYPASYNLSNIISVMAYNQNLSPILSSNYGEKSVDIAGPGDRIRSSLPGKRSGHLTGTSQATAFVSGVAALVKAKYPKLSAKAIKKIIVNSAKKEKSLEGKCRSGGRVDALNAILLADKLLGTKNNTPGKKERTPTSIKVWQ